MSLQSGSSVFFPSSFRCKQPPNRQGTTKLYRKRSPSRKGLAPGDSRAAAGKRSHPTRLIAAFLHSLLALLGRVSLLELISRDFTLPVAGHNTTASINPSVPVPRLAWGISSRYSSSVNIPNCLPHSSPSCQLC